MERAMFAAGCFWGVEAAFAKIEGVIATAVGYSGGWAPQPNYEQVCSGTTGHAEVVKVVYDSEKVSYKTLLDIFWKIHDPTTWNRQGPDVGAQYRSAIFFYTPEQEQEAWEARAFLEKSGRYKDKIVTDIVPAKEFYRAEEYHQQYYLKKGITSPVCLFKS